MARPDATLSASLSSGRRLLLLLAILLPLLGCSSGGECDKCSSDDDCDSGWVCSKFEDGSQRCGSGTGATECRVR